jgi:hypothetical protein
MLAKYVAQVFYVPGTTNKILKVVIPGKRQIIGVENAVDNEEFDQFDKIPPFFTLMIKPRTPSANEAPCATTTMKKLRISKNQDHNGK